ncbi:MAG: ATP-binding protein [Hafnia sp.]|uniref:ATP-binding protein n=1 Tax=Hafnia sp. TaxID=1873498 RepID=UPI002FC81AAB
MKRQVKKKTERSQLTKFKRILRNTEYHGSHESIKKNELQVKKKRYFKLVNKLFIKYTTNKKIVVHAPVYIDYYNNFNFNKTNHFLNKIKKIVTKENGRVSIDFSQTKLITASAMISFLAETDNLINASKLGRNAISFTHPKVEKVESVLKQIGFYELLKKPTRDTKTFKDVSYWNYASGVSSEPQKASDSMAEIEKKISIKARRKLYKGFSEAMANCVEHAYQNPAQVDDVQTKWWAFAGVNDDTLIVVICDKGIGISKSLPLTRGSELIEKFKNALSLRKLNDSAMIKIASRMGRTSTGKSNRGKGLKDIKSIIDTFNSGHLSIYSNKGCYKYFRREGNLDDIMKEHKTSVCGTITEWSFPLNIGEEED